jgi:hypothetical protein
MASSKHDPKVASPPEDQVPPPEAPTPPGPTNATSDRWALVAFVAYLVASVPVLLAFGDDTWFSGDDWNLIAGQRVSDLGTLFEPVHSHWSTVGIVLSRGLYNVFGVHSYVPYQAAVIALHLTLVVLLRVVMRRSGVGAWMATLVAGLFVLFGPGGQNILVAVQITMVTSMVCGFGHLILADHDGPFARRDLIGIGLGVVGLMSSGVGLVLVAIVGLATLLRRGWRTALAHTVPLGAIFGVWWVIERDAMEELASSLPTLHTIGRWVWSGESGVFLALGQHGIVGVALALLLVAGLVLAWKPLGLDERRRRAAVPMALLVGAGGLFVLISTQRWVYGSELARSSRYLSMAVAFTLPALAVAADAVVRRWRLSTPAVVILLLAGTPGAIAAFPESMQPDGYYHVQERLILGAGASPLLDEVPADLLFGQSPRVGGPGTRVFGGNRVTAGFLVAARDAGRLPDPPPLDPAIENEIAVRLGVYQTHGALPEGLECFVAYSPVVISPARGTTFGIETPVAISASDGEEAISRAIAYFPDSGGERLDIVLSDLTLLVESVDASGRFSYCR